MGAGIAWSVSLGVVNLVKLFQVRALLGVVPFDRVTFRCLAAGAASAGVALVLRALPAGGTLGLVADALVVYAAYLAVTLALRLGPEEVETLRGLRGRRELAREVR